VWDIRGKSGPQITVADAHDSDVNVLSWNRQVGYLLASGSDDGSFKVWDLRQLKKGVTLANFNYHKQPITSIEW
jgi:ribosome assembly protein RRB1